MLKAFATGPDLPVRSDIDVDSTYSRHRLRVIVAITAGYALSYTCRLAINVVKKPLIDGGIFTPDDLGQIGSALFYSYAAGKLINGFVSDHANARKFMAIGLLLSALCNLAMGFSTTVGVATLVWGLNGWFQSYGAPACVISLASWFSNKERGRYYGIWTTSHSIGEGLNFIATASLVSVLGWHWGFWGPGIAVMVAAGATYFAMADRPRTMGLPNVADWKNDHYAAVAPDDGVVAPAAPKSVFAMQLTIVRIPAVWIIAFSSALVYITRYAINSWGILYLQEARGYSLVAAGAMLTVSTIAGIVGAVAFGFISDKFFAARRPPVNLLFGVVEITGLVLFFYGPTGMMWTALSMLLFGLGMTGLVASVGGLFAIDICPKRVAGAALGMVGVFSYLGAAIQERVSGMLINNGMTLVNGVRHYDFTTVIWFWIGASVVSLILASTLWNTRLRD
ncbi:MFS transporter [Sphingomonas sp. SUN039]|uniref:MFS transporter n=1 Tax=Sphingomonas sp. SUN039 TaxID=2937787 RepID=UPI002164492A|nr:MFS transporter [Sphingomonas sp. SUN039]UVO54571.1 MFS transporter [Sphingomonas sp. SUN039]